MTGTVLSGPPHRYALGPDAVHVWITRIDRPAGFAWPAIAWVTDAERNRARGFHFEADAQRHIAGRALARMVLGHLLGRDPRSLRFDCNAFGKPQLVPAQNGPGLGFNISHSGAFVLFAVARGREIGVDVERIDPRVEIERLAEDVFCPREREVLMRLPPDERMQTFFRGWSRKEALVKALGQGISLPLDRIDTRLDAAGPVNPAWPESDARAASHWRIWDIELGAGTAAAVAVAVEGGDVQLDRLEWVPPHAAFLQPYQVKPMPNLTLRGWSGVA